MSHDHLLRLVFMGTPEFAVPSLQVLIDGQVDGQDMVVGVITQPDQPAGRGMTLRPPPVKVCALEHHLPVFQPPKLRVPGVLEQLEAWQPDLIVIAAYGKILPNTILDLPSYGCMNVHASLLPKYRGAAPIQWAIANGESKTGVTIMQVSQQMDAGNILYQKAIPITSSDTGGSMHDKLARLGAEALQEALVLFKQGKLNAQRQDETQVTYASLIKKEDGRIDWSQDAAMIERRIRAFHPWPSAYTTLQGKLLKIYAARIEDAAVSASSVSRPGTVLESLPGQLVVATGAGALALDEVQLAGKKRLPIAEFLTGHPQAPGTIFGT